MKKYLFVAIILFIIIGGGWLIKRSKKAPVNNQPAQNTPKKEIKNIKISSTAFKNNEDLPGKYTCDGENVNPPLEFGEIPEGAKSLALIVDHPGRHHGRLDALAFVEYEPAKTVNFGKFSARRGHRGNYRLWQKGIWRAVPAKRQAPLFL